MFSWLDDLIALIPTLVADVPAAVTDVTKLIDDILAAFQTPASAKMSSKDKGDAIAKLQKCRASIQP